MLRQFRQLCRIVGAPTQRYVKVDGRVVQDKRSFSACCRAGYIKHFCSSCKVTAVLIVPGLEQNQSETCIRVRLLCLHTVCLNKSLIDSGVKAPENIS